MPEFNKKEYIGNTLLAFAEELKLAGLNVWTSSDPKCPQWLHFSDGKRIGYVQSSSLGSGWSYSRNHIPSQTSGSGFNVYDNTLELSVRCAQCTLNFYPPSVYYTTKYTDYRDLEHYFRIKLNKVSSITHL